VLSNPGHPGLRAQVIEARANLRPPRRLGQTPRMKLALLFLLVAALALAATVVVRRRSGTRRRAVARLLDAADRLETRLRTARAELEAVTGEDGATREALQEMLRQRLWLQQHGAAASVEQIDQVRQSMEDAGTRLEGQLSRIRAARAPLA
jgi:hypothetical protein